MCVNCSEKLSSAICYSVSYTFYVTMFIKYVMNWKWMCSFTLMLLKVHWLGTLFLPCTFIEAWKTDLSLFTFRDTSISTTAELTSKYHFAAHMGQLIAGIEGHGCHNFYPTCPFPGIQVLQMMKKVRMR